MPTVKNPLEALKQTRWYGPTLKRWKLHLAACDTLHCPELKESLMKFAEEVMATPQASRDSLLTIEEQEPYEPFQRYEVYTEPTAENKKLKFYDAETRGKMR